MIYMMKNAIDNKYGMLQGDVQTSRRRNLSSAAAELEATGKWFNSERQNTKAHQRISIFIFPRENKVAFKIGDRLAS